MDEQDTTEYIEDDSQEGNSPPPVESEPTTHLEDIAVAGPIIETPDLSNSRTLGQPLSEFLLNLEDYVPTVIKHSIFIDILFFKYNI